MTQQWEPPTKEELEKAKAQQEFMEMMARLGGRTLGIELPGDKK